MAFHRLVMLFSIAFIPMIAAQEEDDALRLVLLQSQAAVIDPTETREDPDALLRQAPPRGAPQHELLEIDSPEARLAHVLPLAWLHIPEAGGSFGDTLMSMPGVGPSNFRQWSRHAALGPQDAQELLDNTRDRDDGTYHSHAITMTKETTNSYTGIYRGHTMGFFRQPEQRLITDYYNKFRAYPFSENQPPMLDEFKSSIQGCMVKNLAREGDALTACAGGAMPTEMEKSLSVVRLREAFVFVGITEQWQASICTFRTMFGGTCRYSDFSSSSAGSEGPTTLTDHNTTMAGLADWTDPYDGKLYEEAQNIFAEQLKMYKVTPETCAQCLADAQVAYKPEEWPEALRVDPLKMSSGLALPLRAAPAPLLPQRHLLELSSPSIQEARLADVLPLAWFHVPAAGGSFGKTLMSMPNVGADHFRSAIWGVEDLEELVEDGNLGHIVDSAKIANTYTGVSRGHTMGFFRQPEQRLITDYYNKFRAYPFSENQPPMLDEFKSSIQGCMVKSLAREGDVLTACAGGAVPTEREMALALLRLREAFVFVGITEQWQASVCTFRAMFGGRCFASDFSSSAGNEGPTKLTDHNTTMAGLADWTDPYDGKLYEEAQNIFAEQLKMYKVTPESCAQCLAEAQVSYEPEEWPSQ